MAETSSGASAAREPASGNSLPSASASWAVQPNLGEVITSTFTGNTYTIAEKIGEGNFGVIYACSDIWKNNLAAKVLKSLAPHDQVGELAFAEFQKLMLLRHPYITYVHDAFEYQNTFYIITE